MANNDSVLLKIVAGLCSAGFTIMLILMSNMWSRMDSMDAKMERLLIGTTQTSTTTCANEKAITLIQADVRILYTKLWALKPDEIN